MSKTTYRPAKLFSVGEANAMLPLVRAITADVVQLSRELIERRQRIDGLTSGREGDAEDLYSAELAQIEDELQKDAERLNEYIGELVQLGVQPKGAHEGLVDFPSMMDGRLVWLCWQYGEPEVLYWHEWEAGFGGRQPLAVGSLANGGVQEGDSLLDS